MDAHQGWNHLLSQPLSNRANLKQDSTINEQVKHLSRWPANGEQCCSNSKESSSALWCKLLGHTGIHTELSDQVGAHAGGLKKDTFLEVFKQLGDKIVVSIHEVTNAHFGALQFVLEY